MVIPDLLNIVLFLTAAALLIVVPGPAVIYIVARSLEQGIKSGVISALGVGIGGLVHVLAAAIGVSALIFASATAFMIIKYIGAIYLIYLGAMKLLSKRSPSETSKLKSKSSYRLFFDGMIVNIFNPKTAIFFMAFLPQFITIEKGNPTSQIVFLGILFIIIAIISDVVYAILSGKIRGMLISNKRQNLIKYFSGCIYVLLGLLTLSMNQPSSPKD